MAESRRPASEGMGDHAACACGCGATFRMFDEKGRERKWLPGHYLKWLTTKLRAARQERRR